MERTTRINLDRTLKTIDTLHAKGWVIDGWGAEKTIMTKHGPKVIRITLYEKPENTTIYVHDNTSDTTKSEGWNVTTYLWGKYPEIDNELLALGLKPPERTAKFSITHVEDPEKNPIPIGAYFTEEPEETPTPSPKTPKAKKKITIKYGNVFTEKGEWMIQILGVDALKKHELPRDYLELNQHCYLHDGGHTLYMVERDTRRGEFKLVVGEMYDPRYFEGIVNFLRECAQKLHEINRMNKEKTDPAGTGTIII